MAGVVVSVRVFHDTFAITFPILPLSVIPIPTRIGHQPIPIHLIRSKFPGIIISLREFKRSLSFRLPTDEGTLILVAIGVE